MNNITIAGVFLAGLASFLSPCVFPLIPAYISYIAGDQADKKTTVTRALGFILGFSLIFILLGATATAFGKFLFKNQRLLSIIGGIIIIILGIQMTGFFNFNILSKERRFKMPKSMNWLSSVLIGLAFGAGWTPCIGAFLGTVLIYASQTQTISTGILYLSVYSLGIGLPFLIAAVFVSKINNFFAINENKLIYIKRMAGILIIIFGLLMATNKLLTLTRLLGAI